MKILCIHGVNTNEISTPPPFWYADWQEAIKNQLPDFRNSLEFAEYAYNTHFNQANATVGTYFNALWDAFHSAFLSRGVTPRGEQDISPGSVSMVAKWLEVDGLRGKLRQGLAATIAQEKPDVIVAHSLGSLILYDTLIDDDSLCKDRIIMTLGSQIGYPALREAFGNYARVPKGFRHWFHLHNWQDMVLAFDPLPFTDPNLTTLETPFLYEVINHDALHYLGHPVTAAQCWSAIKVQSGARALKEASPAWTLKLPRGTHIRKASHKRRALLVGINNYPRPEDRLAGCINDVFTMSAVLQERGYDPDSIRIVLDERATTQGVAERLHWLLDDVRPGEERCLYYSGHGAKLAQYNADGEPDHHDEALVTWDFNWKDNCGITDDALASYYANLPYEAKVFFALDCCHSGGMARAGGMTVRGIDPPDDVRHRAIKWDASSGLWVARELHLKNKLAPSDRKPAGKEKSAPGERYLGKDLATYKIGRAVSLWQSDAAAAEKEAKRMGHFGPYNPVIVASCGEGEYAYEYRHGAESHGAFTFIVAEILRKSKKAIPLEELVKQAGLLMAQRLQLTQHPVLYKPPGSANQYFIKQP